MPTPDVKDLRKVSGGFDPANGNWIHRGLDLSKPTEITPEEVAGFKGHYSTQFGLPLEGLDWWLDRNPEVLKRYRLYCSLTLRVEPAVMGGGTLAYYMLMGYVRDTRYVMYSFLNDGLSRAQADEMIAIAFMPGRAACRPSPRPWTGSISLKRRRFRRNSRKAGRSISTRSVRVWISRRHGFRRRRRAGSTIGICARSTRSHFMSASWPSIARP
jgi:hypothetical protein